MNNSSGNIDVVKRNNLVEKLDIDKIHRVLQWATKDIEDVSLSEIEINAKINFKNGITSQEIHNSLIESAANLVSIDFPNYQYVAANLLHYSLRKEVWGGKNPPRLIDFIKDKVSAGLYDVILLEKYTEQEINKIGEFIDHDKDFIFTYTGIKQLCDKYLVKNRITKQIYETPQFAYICISMVLFQQYTGTNRLTMIKKSYKAFSQHKISLATPIMAGARTKMRSYSSCLLADVDDSMDSIFANVSVIGQATAKRYGIGLNMGRMRAINTPIRGGEVVHTGVIPFAKVFEATVKSCHQNGLRGGGGTANFPIWHSEIKDILQLKNNAGTDATRVRKLDYCISISKLFYDRFLKNQNVTLFSPHEVPGLYEAFGHDEFDALYEKYEEDPTIKYKTVVSMRELMTLLIKERVETGRIYIMNIDHVNSHSSFLDDIKMTNLCVEITHPTIPLTSFEDPNGEIGVCILSAINLLEVKNDSDLERTCDITVRTLEELIDVQEYFNKAAENFAKKRRSIAIGVTNLAAWLAKHELSYFADNNDAATTVDILMEKISFYCIKASMELAKEKGPCEKFDRTKYSQGIFPIDTYKREVDELTGGRELALEWTWLREEVKEHGMRHSTWGAQMPCESSSAIQNSTNGADPVQQLNTTKQSKAGNLTFIVPHVKQWKDRYDLAYQSKNNRGYLKIIAVMQKYMDMSLSANTWYNYSHYPKGKLPDAEVIKDTLFAYKYGVKTQYYCNTTDDSKHFEKEVIEDGCSSGACSI